MNELKEYVRKETPKKRYHEIVFNYWNTLGRDVGEENRRRILDQIPRLNSEEELVQLLFSMKTMAKAQGAGEMA